MAFALLACISACSSDDSSIATPEVRMDVVSGGWIGPVVPKLIQGDREFDGNGPRVTLKADLKVMDGDSVTCYVYMHATETTSNWSKAEGEDTWTLYQAPAGWKIVEIYPEGWFCHIDYVDNNTSADYHGCPGFLFKSSGDTSGDDIDVAGGTRVDVRIDDFDVELRKK